MTRGKFIFYYREWFLIGYPLGGTRSKEPCLTTWLCSTTFESSSSDAMVGSIISTSLREWLQISCTSCMMWEEWIVMCLFPLL
jgi:hypothetical protein